MIRRLLLLTYFMSYFSWVFGIENNPELPRPSNIKQINQMFSEATVVEEAEGSFKVRQERIYEVHHVFPCDIVRPKYASMFIVLREVLKLKNDSFRFWLAGIERHGYWRDSSVFGIPFQGGDLTYWQDGTGKIHIKYENLKASQGKMISWYHFQNGLFSRENKENVPVKIKHLTIATLSGWDGVLPKIPETFPRPSTRKFINEMLQSNFVSEINETKNGVFQVIEERIFIVDQVKYLSISKAAKKNMVFILRREVGHIAGSHIFYVGIFDQAGTQLVSDTIELVGGDLSFWSDSDGVTKILHVSDTTYQGITTDGQATIYRLENNNFIGEFIDGGHEKVIGFDQEKQLLNVSEWQAGGGESHYVWRWNPKKGRFLLKE